MKGFQAYEHQPSAIVFNTMGLDGVELVMQIEEDFGIAIPDQIAGDLVTAGALYQFVLQALKAIYPDDICHTSAAFYRLRRGLIAAAGLKRSQIQLDSSLAEMLPLYNRRQKWNALRDATGIALPALRRPQPLVIAISIASTAVPIWFSFHTDPWFVGLLSAPLIAVMLTLFTVPAARLFPSQVSTVRQLVYSVLPQVAGIQEFPDKWTDESVWLKVQKIISEQLSVPLDRITPEAHLVRDLGLS